jgi:hypothetical protein
MDRYCSLTTLTISDLYFQDSLRRRFSSAFTWYGALVDTTDAYIQALMEEFRVCQNCDTSPTNQSHVDTPRTSKLARPSEYLRQRCPLCFGGRFTKNARNK